MMTKKYLRKRIKELEDILRVLGQVADKDDSITANCVKRKIKLYSFRYTKFFITDDCKLKCIFQEV